MTLKEFVETVMAENNIQSDADEIIENITKIARTRAEQNVAVLADDEVREMVINNAELVERAREEKKKRDKERALRKAQLEMEKKEKELEKELEKERKVEGGEQLSLFG